MRRTILFIIIFIYVVTTVYAEETNTVVLLDNISPSTYDDCKVYVSPLDKYGRAGTALAVLSITSIDSEQRQDISMFSPVGWKSNSIFHRCHLVGAQLTTGTACLENLITGTEYLNIEEMLPIENRVRNYIAHTGEHVLYKVTPIYQGSELLPRAVEITVYSFESNGLRFSAYCYNIQPGYIIDYASGASRSEDDPEDILIIDVNAEDISTRSPIPDYILNTKSKRFHYPWCAGVETMSTKNKQEYYGDRETLIQDGYKPCGTCNP